MILWITPEVIENALLPELLHGVPIVNLAVANGVAQAVGAAGTGPGYGLLPYEEVEIGHDARAVLRQPVPLGGGPGLVGEGVVDGDGGRGDEAWLHVPGESHLRVAGAVVDDDGGARGGVHRAVPGVWAGDVSGGTTVLRLARSKSPLVSEAATGGNGGGGGGGGHRRGGGQPHQPVPATTTC